MSDPAVLEHYFYAHLKPDGSGVIDGVSASPAAFPPAMQASMGSVAISEDQFYQVHAGGNWYWSNGAIFPVAVVPPLLATVQAAAAVEVDRQAEAQRLLLLTPGSGQALEYQATFDDATRALQDPAELTSAGYPWLASEVAALASVGLTVSLLQAAGAVMQQDQFWVLQGSAIKTIRRSAKLQIAAATNAAEVAAIMAKLTWPASP